MSVTVLPVLLLSCLLVGFTLLIWSLPTPTKTGGRPFHKAWRRKQRFGFVGLSLVILGVLGQVIIMWQVL